MARSQFIIDIIKNDIDIHTALKRLKVLLFDFENDELNKWVKNEICGYRGDAVVPNYRVVTGDIFGSVWIYRAKYTRILLSPSNLPNEMFDYYLNYKIRDDINTFINETCQNEKYFINIKHECYKYLKINTNITSIISAYVEFPASFKNEIVSNVESKVIEILLELEKEYGNLDSYDIDVKSSANVNSIEEKIYNIIYNDNSITIGDNNKIKDTIIASKEE